MSILLYDIYHIYDIIGFSYAGIIQPPDKRVNRLGVCETQLPKE